MGKKKRVLFVGSFKSSGNDGSVGGQMFACRSLIESKLSDEIEWFLVDSTANSNTHNPLFIRILKVIKRFFKVLYYLTSKKIDSALIFTSNGGSFIEKGSIAIISKLFGTKVIIAPRSGFIMNDIEDDGAMKIFINYVFNNSDFILCQGEKWKSYFKDNLRIQNEKLLVVPNWIDIKEYENVTKAENIINILFLAWVDVNKGIFELVEALAIVTSKQKFILHIAGNGTAMEEIKARIDFLGLNHKVIIHGWVKGDEKLKILKTTDIFILPSYFEGFPNSLLEAMALGIACIATDVGSVSDLIKDGENGLIIPTRNTNAIANALQVLLDNSEIRSKLGINAKESVKHYNSVESAVKIFSRVFNLL